MNSAHGFFGHLFSCILVAGLVHGSAQAEDYSQTPASIKESAGKKKALTEAFSDVKSEIQVAKKLAEALGILDSLSLIDEQILTEIG